MDDRFIPFLCPRVVKVNVGSLRTDTKKHDSNTEQRAKGLIAAIEKNRKSQFGWL